MNSTEDPKNIPDYLEGFSEDRWKNLSESCRQTLIQSISDSVVAIVYLRYKDIFNAYLKIKRGMKKITNTLGVDKSGAPPFMEDMVNSIDPMSQIIYNDLESYVNDLKKEKQETLEDLLQTAVNADGKREIIEAILDEIEDS